MFKITNNTEGRIVINSINVILTSKGDLGSSRIIEDVQCQDPEVKSLERAGFITVEKQTAKALAKELAKKQKKEKITQKSNPIKKKKHKSGGPDGSRNNVVFISEGKIKKGKMVQSIEQDGDLPDPLTADDQARAKDDDTDNIFIG